MNEGQKLLRQRVYYAARDGMAITLYALLADKSKEEHPEYLENLVEEEGQRCTPLMIAAKNGHETVVKMLLTKFKPNIQQEGTVQFDGYVIEGATPLWCAAGGGHLSIVKLLIKHGADVNKPTKSNSTPLRAACFNGRLDIVRYLIENNANIHIANKYNNTCLMIAAYKGHPAIVDYLLEKGANTDTKAHCGASALHFAAEHGHLEIVEKLLAKGAKIMKNRIGMTPLLAAAERTKPKVVEYFIEQPWCSKEERIEALELLGASYANDKDNYDLEKAYYYLEWSMKERYNDNECIMPKRLMPLIPAYENKVECQTLEELIALKNNSNALHMESLVIRERILGSSNPEVPHPIIFRGAVFADGARFDRCIELWQHALYLKHTNHVTVRKDLLRFAQVFSQMLHLGVELPFDYVEAVFEIAVEEIHRNIRNLCSCGPGLFEAQQEELEDNMHTVLYFLVIITKLAKKCTKDQELHVHRLIYSLNHLGIVTRDGSTLLHLALNAETPVDNFHTKNVCKFPCSATAKLLVQCGANVNAMDNKRNTPLHIIAAYRRTLSDYFTVQSIITCLAEAGAHMDSVNCNGETPLDVATNGIAGFILRTQATISLKCIAAMAVKKFNLSYEGSVPHTLIGFIEMHGVPTKPCVRAD